jgi:hypothetical protein
MPHGLPMDLANMAAKGERCLAIYCLDASDQLYGQT